MVGLPGIEPGLYAPEAHVLPVYYSPLTQVILSHFYKIKKSKGRNLV